MGPGEAGKSKTELLELLKLEAPLAVQTRADLGKFAINKFSALPLFMIAARTARHRVVPLRPVQASDGPAGWHI